MRTASDFLMSLQLTGAAKADSLANMQLRLPVVVIGGGLTAIDTATESLAYYVVQVEKFLARHEALVKLTGDENLISAGYTAEERELAAEFLAHARAIRAERTAAQAQGRQPRIAELLAQWGGVTVAYRKRLIDSPSYTLNHEEVEKALEEGIRFAECVDPRGIEIDTYGAAAAIKLRRQLRSDDGRWSDAQDDDAELVWPARTVFVAAGTQPNTVLAREDAVHFSLDGKYFQAIDEDGLPVKPQHAASKPDEVQVLLARHDDGRMVSFFGDLHPSYFGNVVKAMGSARQGYPIISRVLARQAPALALDPSSFASRMNHLLRARVERVERLTPPSSKSSYARPWLLSASNPASFIGCRILRRWRRSSTSPAFPRVWLWKDWL